MFGRRVASVLSVVLLSSGLAVAQGPAKKAPVAPAKEPAPAPASTTADPLAAPAPAPDEGTAVEMAEDPAPADMEGTNENPDAPRTTDEQNRVVPAAADKKRVGYPVEEIFRPITLPQNMSEVSLDLHGAVSKFTGSGVLRARYGITPRVQLGLTYLFGGVFSDEKFGISNDGTKFHPGKALGLDVTVLIQNWIGIKIGVPVYIDPVAVGVQLGVPMRFVFFDKFNITILEDFLSFAVNDKFAPQFYQESTNAVAADGVEENSNNTIQSRGYIQFAGTAAYQHKPDLAILLKLGMRLDDFESTRSDAGDASGATTFIRAGVQLTPKKNFDIGGSLGFDDLSSAGSFGPQVFAAVRI